MNFYSSSKGTPVHKCESGYLNFLKICYCQFFHLPVAASIFQSQFKVTGTFQNSAPTWVCRNYNSTHKKLLLKCNLPVPMFFQICFRQKCETENAVHSVRDLKRVAHGHTSPLRKLANHPKVIALPVRPDRPKVRSPDKCVENYNRSTRLCHAQDDMQKKMRLFSSRIKKMKSKTTRARTNFNQLACQKRYSSWLNALPLKRCRFKNEVWVL